MPIDLWMAFIPIGIAAVLSPGPAVLMAVTHGARHGTLGAAPAIFGNITGLAIMTCLTAIGIGGLLATSVALFNVIKIAGGLYLIYLGIRLLRAKPLDLHGGQGHVSRSLKRRYLEGIGVALSNPKAILVIGALFPQFLTLDEPIGLQMAILAATLMTLSFSALIGYAGLSRTLITRSNAMMGRWFNRISGILFVGFGVALVLDGDYVS